MMTPQAPSIAWHLRAQLCVLSCVISCALISLFTPHRAVATPALDADQSWGRGAHMSLINPALTIDELSVWGLSYDLTSPSLDQLDQGLGGSREDWGHELNLSFNLPRRYSFTVGVARQPLQVQERSGDHESTRWWHISQALRWRDVSLGLTAVSVSNQRTLWISGLSAHLTPWLTTSFTLQDLGKLSLRRGGSSFGIGVKPTSSLLIGATLTPTTGSEGVEGGALDMRLQWTMWRGLALDLGWLGVQGEGYAAGDAAQWGLLRAPQLGGTSNADPRVAQPSSLWRVGLTWRGDWGMRVETGLSAESPAQFALRWRSRSPSRYQPPPPRRVMVVSVSQSQELVNTSSWFGSTQARAPFFKVLRQLDAITELDPSEVAGVVLILKSELGWAQVEELRAVIRSLRLKQHLVFAYLPSASLRSYLVAAACDAIWTSPIAEIGLHGLLVERFYLRALLDRLEISPEVIAAGEYKSAPEVYTRNGPSPEADEVDQRLITARFNTLVEWLAYRAQQQSWSTEPSPALTRGKRLISLRKLKDREAPTAEERATALSWIKGGPYSAQSALKMGLVDLLVSPVKLESEIAKAFPRAQLSSAPLPVEEPGWTPLPKIAVIHAVGPIGGGSSPLSPRAPRITASRYLPLVKRAAYDPQVRGVVLRVDSPGGVITDADLLWVELKALARRKPLAVSMGNVAASGGYYIAAPAHKIFASQSSITGSIGVFAGKVDISGLLESLGIHIHRLRRGSGGEVRSLTTPWEEETRARVQREIDQVYEHFLTRITTARPSLTREQLLPLAGGRVWTGEEARERGLVDVEGGVLDAVKWVTVKAGLARREHRVISLTPRGRPLLSAALSILGASGSQGGSAETSRSSVSPSLEVSRALERGGALVSLVRSAIQRLPVSAQAALSLMVTDAWIPLALDPRF